MSASNQSYKELAIPYFKEAFDIIDSVLHEKEIPYYLIGVTAVELTLLKEGEKPPRGTKDIDFAVMVSSLDQYHSIIDALVLHGFNRVKAPWTIYHPGYKLAVDILPFGEIEQHDTVQFNERYSDLHVLGFSEVLGDPANAQIEETFVKIPTLPGMVVLKLIAWSDRPEERDNDLADILRIIDKFFEHEYDDIVENHFDTFPDGDLDRLIVAGQVLGRKVRTVISKSPKIETRIFQVLENNLTDVENSSIAKEWARIHKCEVKYAHSILEAFHKGLTE